MIKQSTTPGSPYAFVGITPGNGVVFQYGYDVSVSGRLVYLPQHLGEARPPRKRYHRILVQ